MRNLTEYPIEFDECVQTLNDLYIKSLKPDQIGSVQPLCLSLVTKFIKENESKFDKFLKGK